MSQSTQTQLNFTMTAFTHFCHLYVVLFHSIHKLLLDLLHVQLPVLFAALVAACTMGLSFYLGI